jgi:hypothetical protein
MSAPPLDPAKAMSANYRRPWLLVIAAWLAAEPRYAHVWWSPTKRCVRVAVSGPRPPTARTPWPEWLRGTGGWVLELAPAEWDVFADLLEHHGLSWFAAGARERGPSLESQPPRRQR